MYQRADNSHLIDAFAVRLASVVENSQPSETNEPGQAESMPNHHCDVRIFRHEFPLEVERAPYPRNYGSEACEYQQHCGLIPPFQAPGNLALEEESHPSEDLPTARRYLNREAGNAEGEIIKRPWCKPMPLLLVLKYQAFAFSRNSFSPHHERADRWFGLPLRPLLVLLETNPPRQPLERMEDLLQRHLIIAVDIQRNERDETSRFAKRFISRPFGDIDDVLNVQGHDRYVRSQV